ncbi:hypothetical protein SAMN02910358_00620 [Lachnospiraceae bacterium XBB1006]|nr:hypothetical protein SAMN02910358_00620 [Lachnospiraceae bacterium XBB1006]
MRKQIWKKAVATMLAATMMISGFFVPGTNVKAGAVTRSGWNINIYMCGSDLESDGGEATKDLLEIMRAKNVSSNVDIVIQTGGAKQWFYEDYLKDFYRNELGMTDETIARIPIQNINADYIQRYRVKYDNTIVQDGERIVYPSLVCISDNEGIANPQKAEELGVTASGMGDEATLKDFIQDVDSNYDHNVLVLWNHGGGTEGGVCVDDYTGDSLSLVEIDHVLTECEGSIPRGKYDVIGYDACLMSTFETMAMTSRHANYMAASMTLEAGDGWYYTPIIESVSNGAKNYDYTGADFAKAICEAYEQYYLTEEAKNLSMFDPDAFMAAYDMAKVRPMIGQFDKLAWAMTLIHNDDELRAGFEKAAYSAQAIDVNTDLVGMYSFLKKTISYATRNEALYRRGGTKTGTERADILAQYLDAAKALQTSLFEETYCLKLVKGAPEGAYAKEEGISFYYPQKDSYDDGNYARFDYDKLGISTYYQAYAYSVARGITRAQAEKAKTSLSYNKKKGTYTFKLLSDNLDYLTFFGQKGYVVKNGKERLVRYCNQSTDKASFTMKPLTTYPEFNGEPVYLGEKDPTYEDYEFIACVNGEDYESLYLYKEKGKFYVFADHELQAGDVITPVKIEDGEYTPNKKASYTLKKKDINEEGDALLPLTMVKNTDKKMRCTFVAQNAAGTQTKCAFYHDDILFFSKVKASLSKKTFKATGKRICPKVTVKVGKKTLKKNKDYKVTYVNNLGAGTATAKITGIGKYRYAPTKTLSFKIRVNHNRKLK